MPPVNWQNTATSPKPTVKTHGLHSYEMTGRKSRMKRTVLACQTASQVLGWIASKRRDMRPSNRAPSSTSAATEGNRGQRHRKVPKRRGENGKQ